MRLRRRGSVRTRITVLATAVVALALVTGSFALLGLFRGGLLRSQSGSAQERAGEAAWLAVDGGGARFVVHLPAGRAAPSAV